MISYFKHLMQNWLPAYTSIVHFRGIFVVYLEYFGEFNLTKARDMLWTPAIVCFLKLIEKDLVHTETVCFISS